VKLFCNSISEISKHSHIIFLNTHPDKIWWNLKMTLCIYIVLSLEWFCQNFVILCVFVCIMFRAENFSLFYRRFSRLCLVCLAPWFSLFAIEFSLLLVGFAKFLGSCFFFTYLDCYWQKNVKRIKEGNTKLSKLEWIKRHFYVSLSSSDHQFIFELIWPRGKSPIQHICKF
jgi:hypothetical protein